MSPEDESERLYQLGRRMGFWRGFRWGWLWSGIASTALVIAWRLMIQ